jgi:hypothetical protein
VAQTDRTMREGALWMKITRDSKARTFTFARGYAGDAKAVEIQSFPFKRIPTWAEAEAHAQGNLSAYQ